LPPFKLLLKSLKYSIRYKVIPFDIWLDKMLISKNRKATKRPDGPIQVILPKIWIENVGLREGGDIDMEFDDEKLIIKPSKRGR